jgi:hypothetical protein
MRSAKENCQKDVQIRYINWRSQSGKLKRLPPMGLWMHAAAMHRTKQKDCVEINAYFNDQSYEYQTRIIIVAENLYLHIKVGSAVSPGGSGDYQQMCLTRWCRAKQLFIEVPLRSLMLLNYANDP